ncbi:hypothetical protein NC653_037854 [Populus alba x Populus x berolinensis]|uniref:Exostosin GT47 domain-containing protein n=1 Tax=Populus alba x Populus x berolinensis TaxID=444605 RepID=A0AAD6PSI5_9ROSI|nr:hypothetical protein NC653_037854 [Populus alba x Populus x berolinensis]
MLLKHDRWKGMILGLLAILVKFNFYRAYFELHLDDHIWLRWTKLVLQSIAMQYTGSAGDVLEDDPVRRLKVFVYELPSKYNKKILQKDPRCLTHMFAAKIFMHRFLLSSPLRMLNPKEAEWFNTLVYTTCDFTLNGTDHFFVMPHDFGACFHSQEEKAIKRGILPLLQRATLVKTFR